MEGLYRRCLHSVADRLHSRGGKIDSASDLERVRHELDMLAHARESMLTWSVAAKTRYDALCQLECQLLRNVGLDDSMYAEHSVLEAS